MDIFSLYWQNNSAGHTGGRVVDEHHCSDSSQPQLLSAVSWYMHR